MQVLSFYQRSEERSPLSSSELSSIYPHEHVFDQTELTIQDKALTPRQLIDRLNHGILTETDIHRELPNDNDVPLDALDIHESDELDLASAKSFLDKVGNQLVDNAKQQREQANNNLPHDLKDKPGQIPFQEQSSNNE